MKTVLLKIIALSMLLAMFSKSSKAQNDLPPLISNIQTIPTGSLVIAMDNYYQGGTGTTVMNLRAYGLAVELLWNNIPLNWIIKTGKVKDAPDMTVSATMVYPTIGTAATDSFKAGPLVIFPTDTAAARSIITAFNNKISGTTSDIKVYKTNASTTADIRHTLNHKPFIAIYNDGGNATIHSSYLVNSMVDTSRYRILASGYKIDSISCFTFASTPHWAVTTYSSSDSMRLFNLKSFLLSGGNFLAECEGIDAVENFSPVRFMTTNGVSTVNTSVSTQQYKNVDMPIMQFHGAYTQGGGSIYNYIVDGTTTQWKNSMYFGTYFMKNVVGSTALDTVVQINACKISPIGSVGGNIIYLGGHTYAGTSSLADVNGERIYLNSILMPAKRIIGDGTLPSSLSFCQNDTIKIPFTLPHSGFSYNWTGPNGYTSTTEDPVITNAQSNKAGTYTVTLRATEGCNYAYNTIVTVNSKPSVVAATTLSMLCEGDSCTISFSPTAGLSANWFMKDTTLSGCKPTGSILYTASSQKIIPTASGTYAVVVTSAFGCRDTSCVAVTVDKIPVLSSPFSTDSPLCYGRGTRATITPGYGGSGCTETYQWRMDGGSWQSYTSGSTVGISALDSIEIKATRSCTSGCMGKVVRLKWNITSPQIVNGTSALQQCTNSVSGYIATLSAINPSPSVGAWSIVSGPGNIVSQTSLNTTVGSLSITGGTTTVRWIVTNSYNCKDTVLTDIVPPIVDTTLISKFGNQYCLTCPVQDNNSFSYYDLNGKLLATVTDSSDGNSIGNTTMCGKLPYNVSGNPTVLDVPSVPTWIEGAAGGIGYVPQPYLPRFWNINTTNDAPMTVSLYFTDEELAALTGATMENGGYFRFQDVNSLRLVAYPNNTDTLIPAASPNGVVYQPSFERVGAYWKATIQTNRSASFYIYPSYWPNYYGLPVEMLDFTAKPLENSIQLDWSTASELNNNRFEIERQENGGKFIKIGQVNGSDKNVGLKNYNYEDIDAEKGQLYYYRLKQVDNNGEFKYSNVLSAELKTENKFNIGEFKPNPATNETSINIKSLQSTTVEVIIFSVDGSIIKQYNQVIDIGNSEINIDVEGLNNGIYFVQFKSDKETLGRRFIKQ